MCGGEDGDIRALRGKLTLTRERTKFRILVAPGTKYLFSHFSEFWAPPALSLDTGQREGKSGASL